MSTVGGVVSFTVTFEVHVEAFWQLSVAVNVTVVVNPGRQPDGKSAGASFVITAPSHTSVAVGVV